jgi:hypothetical protein
MKLARAKARVLMFCAAAVTACGGGALEVAPGPVGDDASDLEAAAGETEPREDATLVDDATIDADAPPRDDTAVVDGAPRDGGSSTDVDADASPEDARPDVDAPSVAILRPSNATTFNHLTSTNNVLSTPSAATFDTAECSGRTILGRCQVTPNAAGTEACVCRSDELTISGELKVTGKRALVLLALRDVTVGTNGRLRVAAVGGVDGPGGGHAYPTIASGYAGGAGGSFGGQGGRGAPPFGTPDLEPLLGGMRGQAGASASTAGGGGGGAVQISAGRRLVVAGIIDAGGGGGRGGNVFGGGGGGSGGGILLEAPTVEIRGVVLASGGGGGGGGAESSAIGTAGEDGSGPGGGGQGASGGGCALGGYAAGGAGGQGATGARNAGPGSTGNDVTGCIGGPFRGGQGGGGGGIGRIRVNTSSGCACSGGFAPLPTFGGVVLE